MSNLANKITGIIIILLSVLWIYQNINLYYLYHYTDILFAFKYPNWVMFAQVILSVFSIIVGLKMYQLKIKLKKGMLFFMILYYYWLFNRAVLFFSLKLISTKYETY